MRPTAPAVLRITNARTSLLREVAAVDHQFGPGVGAASVESDHFMFPVPNSSLCPALSQPSIFICPPQGAELKSIAKKSIRTSRTSTSSFLAQIGSRRIDAAQANVRIAQSE